MNDTDEEDDWADRMAEARAEYEAEKRPRLFRCSDRMCGGLDCANCYGEQAVREYLAQETRDNCDHADIDKHGICLECGKDMTDDIAARAEARADAEADR